MCKREATLTAVTAVLLPTQHLSSHLSAIYIHLAFPLGSHPSTTLSLSCRKAALPLSSRDRWDLGGVSPLSPSYPYQGWAMVQAISGLYPYMGTACMKTSSMQGNRDTRQKVGIV